jgi:hypothetical protein
MATEYLHGNMEENLRFGINIVDGKFWFDLEGESDKASIIQKYVEDFKKVGVG